MTADKDRNGGLPAEETDLVGQVIRAAGRRPAPPETAYRKTLDIATAALAAKLAARRRRQGLLALAASLIAAVVLVALFTNRFAAPVPQIAQVERVIGAVKWSPGGEAGWRPLRAEASRLVAGSRLRSLAGSKVGLVLAGGASLRMAADTEIELESAARLMLWRGTVYLDTGAAGNAAGSVEIVTLTSTARDVGTQFEVTLNGEEYRLRIREGRVLLSRGPLEASAAAGEELVFSGGGPLQYGRVGRDDPQWRWVEDVAPAPDIDGQPIRVLLDWVARETGRSVRYADAAVERTASRTTLHGTIRRLSPMEALTVMLATTDLTHQLLPDRTILIRSKIDPDGML